MIGTYYKRWATGVYGSVTDLQGWRPTSDDEPLWGVGQLPEQPSSVHRGLELQLPASFCAGAQVRLFTYMGEVNRVTASFLKQLNGGFELFVGPRCDAGVGEFPKWTCPGLHALMYDSGAVVTRRWMQRIPAF